MSRLCILVACMLPAFASLRAGQLSHEIEAEYSYVGEAETRLGHGRTGDVSEQHNLVHYVLSYELPSGALLRFGAEWERFSFGLPERASLPNTLESINLVAGFDFELFSTWLMRVEVHPGFYGNASNLRGQDFNVPIIIGGSYFLGSDLQLIVGVSVDINRQFPVFPAVGVRWSFAERWVLNAVLPDPRLEYQFSEALTCYAGVELLGGTYRVDSHFGTSHGDRRLNSAVVDYTEIRAGAGASWKLSKSVSLEAQAGYMPYRDFDFQRAGPKRRTESGAAYCQLSLSAKF